MVDQFDFIDPIIPPGTQEGMPFPDPQILLGEPPMVEDPPETTKAIDQLNAYLSMTNIAEDIDEDVLKEMGKKVVEDYKIDLSSREEWEEMIDIALDLAKQMGKEKLFHGERMANVKYPALATAAIQFQARALSNIIKGKDVVKGKVVGLAVPPEAPTPEMPGPMDQPPEMSMSGPPMGQPPMPSMEEMVKAEEEQAQQAKVTNKWAKADRIGTFMSYQFLDEMDGWEDDLDQLLTSIPIVGCAFKKTFPEGIDNRPQSSYVSAKDMVVNYYAESFKKASRATHVLRLGPNEIEEKKRSKAFLDQDLGVAEESDENDSRDDEARHIFLEQHTRWDVDDDGYKEPYIITVHKQTEQVVRVVARFDADGIAADEKGDIIKIEPVEYFTRYLFMSAFDGNFYGMGFGSLMGPLNLTINDTINILLDAGKRASRQSGFLGKGVNLGKKAIMYVKSGEWQPVTNTGDDLRKGIVPLPVKEPSPVLFQLLGLMLEASKEVSSVSDVLTGEQQGANASPTTTLALIEQGLKVFSSIYKRTHRSLKSEFRKVRRLNRLYLSDEHYQTVLDDPQAHVSDFYDEDIDVIPVSDETELTHTQKLIKADALNAKKGTGLNDREIDKRYLEALDTPDIEKLLPPEGAEPPEDPELEIKRQELAIKQQEVDNDKRRVDIEEQLANAKIEKSNADTDRSTASADKTRSEAITDEHMEKLDGIEKVMEMQNDAIAKLVDRLIKDNDDTT